MSQTKKGCAGSLPSTEAIHLNCLDAIAILLFIMTRKMSREILDPRKNVDSRDWDKQRLLGLEYESHLAAWNAAPVLGCITEQCSPVTVSAL